MSRIDLALDDQWTLNFIVHNAKAKENREILKETASSPNSGWHFVEMMKVQALLTAETNSCMLSQIKMTGWPDIWRHPLLHNDLIEAVTKNGLKITHININSLRNKINEPMQLLLNYKLHILALSETHLDRTFDDTESQIDGYNNIHKDRNRYGEWVAFDVMEHIPAKVRTDMMNFEAIGYGYKTFCHTKSL